MPRISGAGQYSLSADAGNKHRRFGDFQGDAERVFADDERVKGACLAVLVGTLQRLAICGLVLAVLPPKLLQPQSGSALTFCSEHCSDRVGPPLVVLTESCRAVISSACFGLPDAVAVSIGICSLYVGITLVPRETSLDVTRPSRITACGPDRVMCRAVISSACFGLPDAVAVSIGICCLHSARDSARTCLFGDRPGPLPVLLTGLGFTRRPSVCSDLPEILLSSLLAVSSPVAPQAASTFPVVAPSLFSGRPQFSTPAPSGLAVAALYPPPAHPLVSVNCDTVASNKLTEYGLSGAPFPSGYTYSYSLQIVPSTQGALKAMDVE
ncbi:hypothetical protein DFH06DRAFT_1131366 [Mycena polygramma]|nr:hypothetical protein DFH06DRAFT_1131366 [Mycena polygramma]